MGWGSLLDWVPGHFCKDRMDCTCLMEVIYMNIPTSKIEKIQYGERLILI